MIKLALIVVLHGVVIGLACVALVNIAMGVL